MSDDFSLDHAQIRRYFDQAAGTYENHDALHQAVEEEVLSRLDFYLEKPALIVDVGSATGRACALLKKRYPKAEVVALDQSMPMLRSSERHRKRFRSFVRVAGDANKLPFANRSVDIVHSNLRLPWSDHLPTVFAEWQRVLKPGGIVVFSTLGPDALKELRAAWAATDDSPHVGQFLDMHDIGDSMLHARLYDPVLDISHYRLTYASPEKLLAELKGLGATNANSIRRRTLTGKQRYQRMLDAYNAGKDGQGRVHATCEVVVGHAWGQRADQESRIPGVRLPPPVSE